MWWCLLFKPTATMAQPLTDATRFQHADFQHVDVRNTRPEMGCGAPERLQGWKRKTFHTQYHQFGPIENKQGGEMRRTEPTELKAPIDDDDDEDDDDGI